MTAVILLDSLKTFTRDVTKDLIMPVRPSEEVEEPEPRAADVYTCHLPALDTIKRKAPCILHQLVTRKDIQPAGEPVPNTAAVVRSAFCVYNDDEEEGGLMLLNLMERSHFFAKKFDVIILVDIRTLSVFVLLTFSF